MAFIRQLPRGNCLCPLAILHLGLRRPRRDIDFELNQEVHGPHPCAPRVLAAIPGGAMANVEVETPPGGGEVSSTATGLRGRPTPQSVTKAGPSRPAPPPCRRRTKRASHLLARALPVRP